MFDSWEAFAAFLEGVQGNFYYTALLLLLLSVVSLVLQSRAKPEKLDWRVNLAIGSMMGLRLIMLAAYGFYWFGGLAMPAAAAPIERTIHLVGILLFAWIWSRLPKENGSRQAIMALAILGVFAVFLYITLASLNEGATSSFNYTDRDYVWSGACLVFIFAGAIAAFRRGQTALFGVLQMGVFLLGQIVHLLLAEPFGNMPLAAEAASLLALPFLFFLPVKEEKKEPEAGTEAFFPKESPVYEMAEIGKEAEEPPLRSPEAEELAKQTAAKFRADVSAFATLDNTQNEIQVHAGYNASLASNIDLAIIPSGDLPRTTETLSAGQTVRLSADQKQPDLETLVRALKLSFPGNLLAVQIPNERDNRLWFVALVRMNKPWQLKDEVAVQQAAGDIGQDLIEALGYLDRVVAEPGTVNDFPLFEQAVDESAPSPESTSDDTLGDFLSEREQLQAENERFKQDISRLLAHINELKSEPPTGGGQALLQGAALVTALQLENDQLKSTLSSLQTSQAPIAPIGISVEEAKEELRLALEEVATLQERLDTAQKAMLEASAFQAPGRKIDANQVEVIASIAQELRQPLSSVMGYTDLLLGESVGILGALQRKFLERVRNSTERMNALIGDLIRIAELDQAGYTAQRKPVDLAAVIDEAIGQLRGQLQQKHIALRVNLPSKLPELNTDSDALQQILYHLLQNADAATPAEGSISLRAVMDSQPEYGDFVLLQVSDSGGGIPEEDLPRVFSRVYRANNPVIKGVGDTGVGLTIAETLTQALGGRIWVESQADVGATFSVLLPLQPVSKPEETLP